MLCGWCVVALLLSPGPNCLFSTFSVFPSTCAGFLFRCSALCAMLVPSCKEGVKSPSHERHTKRQHVKLEQLDHCTHTCLLLHLKNHRRILVLRDVATLHAVPLGEVGVG